MPTQEKNLLVILIGPPGSGKGTQAELLAEELGLFHLGSSEIIKEKLPSLPTQERLVAEKAYNSGGLIPDELIARWVIEKIEKLKSLGIKGIAVDGYPRTLKEAEILDGYLSQNNLFQIQIIFINISPEESLRRRLHRRVCANCRHALPYNEKTKNLTSCPKCGGPLIVRELDKSENILEERLRVYEKLTMPVIRYYRQSGVIKEVNGNRSIEGVHQSILEALKS